jgi:hypothetical protein
MTSYRINSSVFYPEEQTRRYVPSIEIDMYLIFIRPLLEYAGEVWDNCTLADSERLEKIQLEAARIVTGLTSYASILSIYKETGWTTKYKNTLW